MSNKLFKQYKELARPALIKSGSRDEIRWLQEKLRRRKVTHEQVREGRRATRLAQGQMLTYAYDPKTKETLPYWDTQPLIILLDFTKDGWYGANLHYLPPSLRAELLYELNTKNSNLAKIKMKLENNKYTRACLKRYLTSHLVTKPVRIPKDEWAIAVSLPFEAFEGATKKTVWTDSRKKIR